MLISIINIKTLVVTPLDRIASNMWLSSIIAVLDIGDIDSFPRVAFFQ